jgi:nucleoside-diphosphate-sugar epimerase
MMFLQATEDTMNDRTLIHTVFGAGQVGRKLADTLLARGDEVRLVRRSAPGDPHPGLTWLQGDVTDPGFALDACRGADVVYNCVNPTAYHRWDELLPPLVDGIREATARAGARLVVLDNLYMYGRPDAVPFDEDTPWQPRSRKGELRARLARETLDAHARGDLEVAIGRASDYFGPDSPNTAVFLPRTIERLRAGKPAEVLGDVDQRHSYTFTPDAARGLAALGTSDPSWGRVWHLPTTWHGTTRGLMQRIANAAGVELRVRRIPRWVMQTAGVVVPLVAAVNEMVYQWEGPFVVDDSRFRAAFGVEPTPVDDAVRATLGLTQVARAA